MLSSRRVGLAVAVILVLRVPCTLRAEDRAGEGRQASADEIAKWIEQLDSDQFSQREAAGAKLSASGKAAIPALVRAAKGESLEVTSRAVALLGKLLESSDRPTQDAAKAALQSLVNGDCPAAAHRASMALRPKQAPQEFPAAGGRIVFGGGGPIQIGAVTTVNGMTVKTTNGVKQVAVEQDGKKIKIVDDSKKGIRVEIVTKKNGKDVTEAFEAKSADELGKKHPEAFKLYKQYAQNQGMGAVAGAGVATLQIQIQAGGVQLFPGPALAPIVPAPEAPATSKDDAKRPAASRLVGTWKLVSIDERDANGQRIEPLDFGPEPIGMIVYDATGHVSVNAMRRGRSKFASDDVHLAPAELAKAAMVGYGAYFGTYTVDEKAGLVVHHVEGSLIPNWEGSEQRRRFTISGDKLTLEPPEIRAAGQKRTRRLTWQRVP